MADDTGEAGATFKRIGRGVDPVDGEGAKALVEYDTNSNFLQIGQSSVLVRHSSPNEDMRLKLKLGQLKQQLVSGSSSLTSLAVCSRVCVLLSAILHLHCIFVDRGRARAVAVVVVVVLLDM